MQLLSKKHGQLKQAITKMVQVVMGFLDQTPSMEVKMSVIETLRTVTEGKVSCSVLMDAVLEPAANLVRFSSRSSERVSREYCQTSSVSRETLPQRQTFYVSCKSRHSDR